MKIKYILFFLIATILYLGFTIVISFIKISDATNHSIKPRITNCYNNIFLRVKSDFIKSDLTFFNENRFPVATFNYKDDYKIIVYKFPIRGESDLNKIVNVTRSTMSLTYNLVYNKLLFLKYYDYQTINNNEVKVINNINLSLSGSSIKNIIKTKTILGYNLRLNRLGIRKNNTENTDILVNPIKNTEPLEVEIAFIRKKNKVFFVLMIPNDDNVIVKCNTLIDLIST
jgi:hypothetical protein